jgi:lysophospholipase L1-like esterase
MERVRTRRSATVIVVFLGLASALLIGEAVVRVLAPQTLSIYLPRVNGVGVAQANATGRICKPGYFDVAVRFNGQRFRADRDYAVATPPGRRRIAILGDSFVFGWGVEAHDAFPAQLESILRHKGADVEVINAGIPGQSLGEKAIWYSEAVARFHPDIVVLTVLVDDVDAENGLRLFQWSDGAVKPIVGAAGSPPLSALHHMPGYDFLRMHSHLFTLLGSAIGVIAHLRPTNRVIVDPASNQVEVNRAAFVRDGLPMLNAEVHWLRDEVRANGGRFVVVFLPVRESIYRDSTAYGPQIRWKERAMSASVAAECARDNIPFLDLTEHMNRLAAATPRELYFSGGETHPNAFGHHGFADGVAAFLDSTPGWDDRNAVSP